MRVKVSDGHKPHAMQAHPPCRAVPSPLCHPQATTNALLSHFFSLTTSLWLLRIIANRPSAAAVLSKTQRTVAAMS